MYGYFYSTVFNMLSVLYPVLYHADYTIHGLFQKPVVYCKYLDPVLKYDILEIFGFGLNILYILNIWIRYNVLCTANIWIRYNVLFTVNIWIWYNVLCNTVHIYVYSNTLQDGVGTPPGATKIVENFFLYYFLK